MEVKDLFVPYELAKELKELGFNEDCFSFYQKNKKLTEKYKLINNFWTDEELMGNPKRKGDLIQNWKKEQIVEARKSGRTFEKCIGATAPLYQQAFRWFREKYKINSGIIPYYDYFYFIIKDFGSGNEYDSDDTIELTYEEAELECLKKLIQIVKDGKTK